MKKDMKFTIYLPNHRYLQLAVNKINAEAINGRFTLLPRHIDFFTALVPGILIYWSQDKQKQYVAIDSGILIKQGSEVIVSTHHAVSSDDLEYLERLIEENYNTLTEQERTARTALARLEARIIQQFVADKD